jgi:hypothetical protein
MFYRKEEVDSVLMCSICSDIFQDSDPRILPCGESACHNCIQSSSDANNELECQICKEKHKPASDKGFPRNLGLSRLTKTKADQVYRNSNVEELKSKLDEIKVKSDDLKANFDNGTDQIKEYCIQLRNQVHLQTDILLEQIHEFNEKMIAEIDQYEGQCVSSFNNKSPKYNNENMQFLSEINNFYTENAKYLSEFRIDDAKIHDGLVLADSYLKKLNREDSALKKIKFNKKLMEFKKSDKKPDKHSLGLFDFRQIITDLESVKEIQLCDQIVQNFNSSLHLFKLENDTNAAFYIDYNYYLNMVTFDNSGQVINQNLNLFDNYQIVDLKVVKLGTYFSINVDFGADFDYEFFTFRGQEISFYDILDMGSGNYCQNILIIADEDLNYINHLNFYSMFKHMTANTLNLLCIDSSDQFSCYDLTLDLVMDHELDKVQKRITTSTLDLEMSDTHLFILCNTHKLKIFDLKTCDLVQEISVSANQIRLVFTDHIALFDPTSRMLHLHNQNHDFALDEEISLDKYIDAGLTLARDKTKTFSFYNNTHMKFFTLD